MKRAATKHDPEDDSDFQPKVGALHSMALPLWTATSSLFRRKLNTSPFFAHECKLG